MGTDEEPARITREVLAAVWTSAPYCGKNGPPTMAAMTTAATPLPQSPRQFAEAALQVIAKGLDADTPVETIQKDLDALVSAYEGRTPTLVMKAIPSRRMIYGWGSVVTKDGAAVTDLQQDVLDIDNVRDVVHEFMKSRDADVMHERETTGEIVDSFVMDAEVAKAFGVNFGREGWMVGYKVHSDKVWKRVESGELTAFSIDADGIRTPISE